LITSFSRKELAHLGILDSVLKERVKNKVLGELIQPDSNRYEILKVQWMRQHNIASKSALSEWLRSKFLDLNDWEMMLAKQWQWSEWCLKNFKGQINSQYLKSKSMLDHVVYSLVRVKDKGLAYELYLRIKEEETSFEQIATDFSEGPEKENSGKIGPLPMNKLNPLVSNLLQISQPHQLWPPRHVEGWWIIIRLEELRNTDLTQEIQLKLALELGDHYLEEILHKKNN